MRILHVSDTYPPIMGGIEAQVQQLAQCQSRGNDVAVFTTTPAHPGDRGRSLERDGEVAVFRLAARVPLRLPISPFAQSHFRDLHRRLRPDVVHFHMGGMAPTAQLSHLAVAGQPAVLTIHSMWSEAAIAGYRALSSATSFSRWGPVLSTVTATAATRIHSATGMPVRVLGCGTNTREWRVEPVAHQGVHVVSATRFTERKRTLELLEILESAHGRAPHIRATIAGEGPLLDVARMRAARWDWLDLPGRLAPDELRALYARSDIFALPSILESFSVAALEAQCAGLAVVVRAETGTADRITQGLDGYAVDSDDAMADAITGLAQSPEDLGAMKRYARENPPPFDWSDVTQRVSEAYAEALARWS